MKEYIEKNKLISEIEKRINNIHPIKEQVGFVGCSNTIKHLNELKHFVEEMEVVDKDSIKEKIEDESDAK